MNIDEVKARLESWYNGEDVNISPELLDCTYKMINGLKKAKEKITEMMDELENTTQNRHMNDLEYGRYSCCQDVLELLEDIS